MKKNNLDLYIFFNISYVNFIFRYFSYFVPTGGLHKPVKIK